MRQLHFCIARQHSISADRPELVGDTEIIDDFDAADEDMKQFTRQYVEQIIDSSKEVSSVQFQVVSVLQALQGSVEVRRSSSGSASHSYDINRYRGGQSMI